jgi:hypothetical protein
MVALLSVTQIRLRGFRRSSVIGTAGLTADSPAVPLTCEGLVATTLPARDRTAIVPFNRGRFHAAAPSGTNRHTTWADANPGIGVIPATVPVVTVVAVPPDLDVDLRLSWSDERGNVQHRCGCCHGKSDLHHVGILLGASNCKSTGKNNEGSTPQWTVSEFEQARSGRTYSGKRASSASRDWFQSAGISAYRAGRSPSWIKVKNRSHPAMERVKESFLVESAGGATRL